MPSKNYEVINWEDGSTSRATPLNAANLNYMDEGIAVLYMDLATAETAIESLQQNLSSLTDRVAALEDNVTALQADLSALTARVEELEPDTEPGTGE